ncbi:hypothetical protein PR048_028833 [Dryococelus australis]|uniref:Uncharacterized protein n=1 Tax=Dryococelus australis TaxID=614101 RepID=A0ABQ9GBN7_9NEOP|nr:hypothetical protein PR048_028833 [Dryococelus australis]
MRFVVMCNKGLRDNRSRSARLLDMAPVDIPISPVSVTCHWVLRSDARRVLAACCTLKRQSAVVYWFRTLASRQGETGLIPGAVASGFSLVGIVLDDAADRRVFLKISRFRHSYIPALLHTHLTSPSPALKASMLGAAQISALYSTLPALEVVEHTDAAGTEVDGFVGDAYGAAVGSPPIEVDDTIDVMSDVVDGCNATGNLTEEVAGAVGTIPEEIDLKKSMELLVPLPKKSMALPRGRSMRRSLSVVSPTVVKRALENTAVVICRLARGAGILLGESVTRDKRHGNSDARNRRQLDSDKLDNLQLNSVGARKPPMTRVGRKYPKVLGSYPH